MSTFPIEIVDLIMDYSPDIKTLYLYSMVSKYYFQRFSKWFSLSCFPLFGKELLKAIENYPFEMLTMRVFRHISYLLSAKNMDTARGLAELYDVIYQIAVRHDSLQRKTLYFIIMYLTFQNGIVAMNEWPNNQSLINQLESRCWALKYLSRTLVREEECLIFDDIFYEVFSYAGGEVEFFPNFLKNVLVWMKSENPAYVDFEICEELILAFGLKEDDNADLIEFSKDISRHGLLNIRKRPTQSPEFTTTTLKLRPNDFIDDFIEIPVDVAMRSQLLIDFAKSKKAGEVLDLANISSHTLLKVINFCEHETKFPTPELVNNNDALTEWQEEYLDISKDELFELIMVSNYLDIESLMDTSTKAVANMIRGKTAEEIRVLFDIKNDFTPEEEERIKRQSNWIEEMD